MKMPGFTAEASLHRANTHYRIFGSTHRSGATGMTVPQLRIRSSPTDSCDPTCLCVSPFNCPCCFSIDDSVWPQFSRASLKVCRGLEGKSVTIG